MPITRYDDGAFQEVVELESFTKVRTRAVLMRLLRYCLIGYVQVPAAYSIQRVAYPSPREETQRAHPFQEPLNQRNRIGEWKL